MSEFVTQNTKPSFWIGQNLLGCIMNDLAGMVDKIFDELNKPDGAVDLYKQLGFEMIKSKSCYAETPTENTQDWDDDVCMNQGILDNIKSTHGTNSPDGQDIPFSSEESIPLAEKVANPSHIHDELKQKMEDGKSKDSLPQPSSQKSTCKEKTEDDKSSNKLHHEPSCASTPKQTPQVTSDKLRNKHMKFRINKVKDIHSYRPRRHSIAGDNLDDFISFLDSTCDNTSYKRKETASSPENITQECKIPRTDL